MTNPWHQFCRSYVISITVIHMQGLMEVATGLGFTAGPPIGALLYDVR